MRIPSASLRRYLLAGQLSRIGCLRRPIRLQKSTRNIRLTCIRYLNTNDSPPTTTSEAIIPKRESIVPLRKELKDEKRLKKQLARDNGGTASNKQQSLEDWELTVGIEIHAQLNTPRKLFSAAASTIGDEPNSHVAFFDLAIPGTQPQFQKECLIPAIRAAHALNCNIAPVSKFDRKHYFHWDQPNGYQITQYYQPFAKDGYVRLYKHDGIAEEDGDEIKIGIKQVQMEQDTAKTISQPGDIHLIDYNRAGVPLIEIITLPQIHYPATAAALVRKVQILLNAVDACVLGMESGGLRADVNVSVKRRNETSFDRTDTSSYAGITNLGQRTEIKNLSSFKAVEAAIIAERDRQVSVIEAGGVVESETRGWTIGSTETTRLRGKEGEVDYRYMPDADIPPIHIGSDLIHYLKRTMGVLPDEELKILTEQYGLAMKDALALVSLEDGARAEYFYEVVDELGALDESTTTKDVAAASDELSEAEFSEEKMRVVEKAAGKWGRVVGNWVLHELGGLISASASIEADSEIEAIKVDSRTEDSNRQIKLPIPHPTIPIPPDALAKILHLRSTNRITAPTAKKLVSLIFHKPSSANVASIKRIITKNKLWFAPLSQDELRALAKDVIREQEKVWENVVKGKKGSEGKIMFLVGKMMRSQAGEEGRVDAKDAGDVLRGLVEEERATGLSTAVVEEAVAA